MISKKISDWADQWKMKFNPDPNKQAQEVHFSNRTNKDSSLFITFNKSLSNKLSRDVLFRIYKFFVRPNLDYGDIVYNKPNNESFTSQLERTQYKAYLAITVAIRYIP